MVTKIVSGAQTGSDRAGLDAGLALGLKVGGWIPKGCRTDEGRLSAEKMTLYNLREHVSYHYPPRTEQNVLDSDGTVLFGNMDSPGCALTIRLCKKHGKPYIINPSTGGWALRDWTQENNIHILNVAGNRERTNPGIYAITYSTLIAAFGPASGAQR